MEDGIMQQISAGLLAGLVWVAQIRRQGKMGKASDISAIRKRASNLILKCEHNMPFNNIIIDNKIQPIY